MRAVPSILLAEDNPSDVFLVQEALRAAEVDCNLHVLTDGAQVVDFIDALDADGNTSGLDLLLLDMHLPKRDGREILQRLRCTKRLSGTPVVIMTGSDLRHDNEDDAALHYFSKPITLSAFMEIGIIVREVLAGRAPSNRATGEWKVAGIA